MCTSIIVVGGSVGVNELRWGCGGGGGWWWVRIYREHQRHFYPRALKRGIKPATAVNPWLHESLKPVLKAWAVNTRPNALMRNLSPANFSAHYRVLCSVLWISCAVYCAACSLQRALDIVQRAVCSVHLVHHAPQHTYTYTFIKYSTTNHFYYFITLFRIHIFWK